MPRSRLAVLLLLTLDTGCSAGAPAEPSTSTTVGTWHLEALPPEPATQLTPECYRLLSAIHFSDPQLTFSGDRVRVRAQSIGNLLTWSDDWFATTRQGDQIHLDTSAWARPPSALIPCGAIPGSLTISPSGERLTANVVGCSPCAHEAAMDGLVGLSFVRTR